MWFLAISSETWAHEQLVEGRTIVLQVQVVVVHRRGIAHGPVAAGHEQLLLDCGGALHLLGSPLNGDGVLDLLEHL